MRNFFAVKCAGGFISFTSHGYWATFLSLNGSTCVFSRYAGGFMGVSLCKVNCCNIRLQRVLYVLILPEFSGKTQLSLLLEGHSHWAIFFRLIGGTCVFSRYCRSLVLVVL